MINAINTRLEAETIAYILDHARAKILLTDPELSPAIKAALGQVEQPPLVVDVVEASPAWRFGLRKDDIIVSVNRDRVSDLAQMRTAIADGDRALLLTVRRQGAQLHLVIR